MEGMLFFSKHHYALVICHKSSARPTNNLTLIRQTDKDSIFQKFCNYEEVE